MNKKIVLTLGLGILLSSCSDKLGKQAPDAPEKTITESLSFKSFEKGINDYTASLKSVQQITPFEEREFKGAPQSGSYVSFLRATGNNLYEQARAFENQMLFSDQNVVFFPGALLDAQSVVNGDYDPINIASVRKPITLSISLTGANTKTSTVVNNPSLSGVRDAVNELINRGFDAPPAYTSYTIEEVHNSSQLKIALGGNYKGTANTVEASAGFDYKKDLNRFIVKVEQVFYDITLDEPEKVSDFFKEEFNYKEKFGDTRPVYVSSVKYGRVLLLGIETTMSKIEAEAKLNATFVGGKVGVNAETAFNDLKNESSIKGRIIGGNAALGSVASMDLSAVRKFIEDGAKLSKDNPGAPIGYTLKELGKPGVFKTVIYSQYPKTDPFGGRFDHISFRLVVPNKFLTKTGGTIKDHCKWYLKVGGSEKSELKEYDWYYGNYVTNIPSYKSHEKIQIILERNDAKDGMTGPYTFDLPLFENLARVGEKKGKEMVFHEDRDPLIIADQKEEVIIHIGIQNMKMFESHK